MLLELTEKWKLTTQNDAYAVEGNHISKQNRYHLRRPIYSELRIYTSC